MRILLISDTHGRHLQFKFPVKLKTVDIILHAGDFSMVGTIPETSRFLKWYSELPIEYRVLVAGNHDMICERSPRLFKRMIDETDIIYLEDTSVDIKGLKIHGSPMTPTFGYDWAFNRERGNQIKKHWSLVDNDTDILITHGPPFKILDHVPRDNQHVGCGDLREAIKTRIKPKIHLFGHIHEAYGIHEEDGTMFVNGSIVDGYYTPHDRPVIVDVDLKTKKVTLVQHGVGSEDA